MADRRKDKDKWWKDQSGLPKFKKKKEVSKYTILVQPMLYQPLLIYRRSIEYLFENRLFIFVRNLKHEMD